MEDIKLKDIVCCVVCTGLLLFNIVGWSCLGRIWEDQKRCENGATEYCIGE